MANYQLLKADIDAKVYQNGAQEITGANLNSVLNAMVTTLGAEYQFAGVATKDTNPGTPDAKVFYIANGKGTYTNFGGIQVTEDEVVILYYDTAWHKVATGIASQEKLSELGTEVKEDLSLVNTKIADIPIIPIQSAVKDGYVRKDLTTSTSSLYEIAYGILLKEGDTINVMTALPSSQYGYSVITKCDAEGTPIAGGVLVESNGSGKSEIFTYTATETMYVCVSYYKGAEHKVFTVGDTKSVTELNERVNGKGSIINIEFVNGYILTNSNKTSFRILQDSSYKCAVVKCFKGDVLRINTFSSENALPWAIADLTGRFISKSTKIKQENVFINIEQNCQVIINHQLSRGNYSAELTRYTNGINQELESITTGHIYSLGDFTGNIPLNVNLNSGIISESAHVSVNTVLKDSFNIRFKFKLNEDVYKEQQDKVLLRFKNLNTGVNTDVIKIITSKLKQYTTTFTDEDGSQSTAYHPVLEGGLRFIPTYRDIADGSIKKQNIGNYAFCVGYTGSPTDSVSLENDGSRLILRVNGTVTNYDFSQYRTVSKLYDALSDNPLLDVDFNELQGRETSELAVFEETKLTTKFYGRTSGSTSTQREYYYDAAKLHIPYSMNNEWHQVEIVAIDGVCYACVDGYHQTFDFASRGETELVFGYNCEAKFKDVEICMDDKRDAEIVNAFWGVVNGTPRKTNILVSSVNPYIVCYMSHHMINRPSHKATPSEIANLYISSDMLQRMASEFSKKGYVAKSVDEIIAYLDGNTDSFPKKSYTFIFDDYDFENYLDAKNRSVFTRNGMKPSLAIITNVNNDVEHNGENISTKEAINIGKNCGFGHISHTHTHRNIESRKFSDMENDFKGDMYGGDNFGIDSNIVVFPYGSYNAYALNTMRFLGMKAGFQTITGMPIRRYCNKYNLGRVAAEFKTGIENILDSIV